CTYAEDRLSTLGLHPKNIFRLMNHASADLKTALLRSLARMSTDHFSQNLQNSLYPAVERIFQSDPNAGLHSVAQWALKNWGRSDRLKELTDQLISTGPVENRRWYVNSQGQTLIILKGPIESRTGSPPEEKGDSDERICTRIIPRDFAMCST